MERSETWNQQRGDQWASERGIKVTGYDAHIKSGL